MQLPDFSKYTNAELMRYVHTVGGTSLERELADRLDELSTELQLVGGLHSPENPVDEEHQ
jgi:hypothetical protein